MRCFPQAGWDNFFAWPGEGMWEKRLRPVHGEHADRLLLNVQLA